MEEKLFSASGAHSREVEVSKHIGICFECRKENTILIFDNSDAEYTPIKFCFNCIKNFFDGKVSKNGFSYNVREL